MGPLLMPPENKRVLQGWKNESYGGKRLKNRVTWDLEYQFYIRRPDGAVLG